MSRLQPLLDRDGYSDEEWALVSAGRCVLVVEARGWDRIVRCGEASDPNSHYRYCADHDRRERDESANYGQ